MNFHFSKLPNYKLVRQFSTNFCDFQKKTHYDCLEITPKATQTDVKSAYYKLSKKYHPDINQQNPSAAERFRDITEAYEVLGNVKSRKLYDRGMLVRGDTVQDYPTSRPEDPVRDDYKHAPFYHSRNKPSKKTSPSEKVKYDMDAWTRAHYSETFAKQYDKKVGTAAFNREKFDNKNEESTLYPVITIFFLCIIGVILVRISPSNEVFDTPSTNLKPENPD